LAAPAPLADHALAPLLARWRLGHAQLAQLRLLYRRLGPAAASLVAASATQASAAAAISLLRSHLVASSTA
ncbi:MAG: hypothetical protein K2Y51_06730, partial [Gammaproteobacteria bacterium]|nr:hypothetical protein [Gammaproteobacteria bacterium]